MPADCNCKEFEPGVIMRCLGCEMWVCSSCGCLDCAAAIARARARYHSSLNKKTNEALDAAINAQLKARGFRLE
jgi:hypothetical protein